MNVLTYEQLKQRLDAVVAECAVVKSLNSKLCDELRGYETDNEDFWPAPQSLALAYSTETHAADAALAEVEAKAIEKFAYEQRDKSSAAARAGMKDLASHHEFSGLQALAYVAKLRGVRV